MKEKIQKLLAIFVLLNEAKKQFKEFEDSVPTDICDPDYISQYPRAKFNEYLVETKDNLWAIIGKVTNFDLETFTALAVDYLTGGNVVLEKEEPTTPNDNPNPNEEDAE